MKFCILIIVFTISHILIDTNHIYWGVFAMVVGNDFYNKLGD